MKWTWKGGCGTITLVATLLVVMTVIVATTTPSPLVHPSSSSWPLSLYSCSACDHGEEKSTSMGEETAPLFDVEDGGRSIDLDFDKGIMTSNPKYCPSVLATLLYDRKSNDGDIYALSVGTTPSPVFHLWPRRKSCYNSALRCSRDQFEHNQLEEVNHLAVHVNRPPVSPRASCERMADLPVRLRLQQPYLNGYNGVCDELSCSSNSAIGERPTASLKAWDDLHPQKTGTTLAGVVFDGGVVIGADSRSTSGDVVADKFTEKVHPLAHNMAICGAGTSADCDKISQNVRLRLKLVMQQDVGEKEISVFTVLKLLCKVLFENSNISAGFLLGGWDTSCPHLFAAQGSGSLAAIGCLENGFRLGMLREEAEKLVRLAVLAGIENDLHSGSEVHLCTITKDGAIFSKETCNDDDPLVNNGSNVPFLPNSFHHIEETIKGESSTAHNNLRAVTGSDSPKQYGLFHRGTRSVRIKTERLKPSLRSIPALKWVALHPFTTTTTLGKEDTLDGVNNEMDHDNNNHAIAAADPENNRKLTLKIVTSSSNYLLDNAVEPL